MRCKRIQRRLIDGAEGSLPVDEARALAEHVAACPACAAFEHSLAAIRKGVADAPRPVLSEAVDAETRKLCAEELGLRRSSPAPTAALRRPFPVPLLIRVVLPVLMILTAVVMGFGLQLPADRTGTILSTASLMLILQNAIMLVFAPILIRTWRRKRSAGLHTPGDFHAS